MCLQVNLIKDIHFRKSLNQGREKCTNPDPLLMLRDTVSEKYNRNLEPLSENQTLSWLSDWQIV